MQVQNPLRKIIHVDMDAFFASVVEREHPSLQTKPLVIAKDPNLTGGRGVVTTANYRARQFGIHSAMPAEQARRLCPQAVFFQPDFTLFRMVSDQIHQIFHEYTDQIESVALDEAYLDITDNRMNVDNPVWLAHLLQSEIWEKTHLTCSTGISYCKFLAKEASDYQKPAGMTMISEQEALPFLKRLPIQRFRGVGKQTSIKMEQLGIKTGADLYQLSEALLINQFGKLGYILYRRVRGIDDRPVIGQRLRKSLGKEETFRHFLTDLFTIQTVLSRLAKEVCSGLQKSQLHGKTLVLKVRYADFTMRTRRLTRSDFFANDVDELQEAAMQILTTLPSKPGGIRLLGLTVTNLANLHFTNLTLPLEVK
ncbi:DNA polymerase IV [Fructilactobacillus florum]|nr:DNA polymerase IV [Fructilactobacillus florum]